MLPVTLRYYATGNFLKTVGDFVGIDKGTASRIVWKVTRAISGLYHKFIKLSRIPPEFKGTAQEFHTVARFPKCIGALDCTHVKIISPGGNNAEMFRDRKGFFFFNDQAICGSNCMFQDVVCRWPGSTHDLQSTITFILSKSFAAERNSVNLLGIIIDDRLLSY
nr:unnamed protein product [Callosobruchus analis]